MDNLAELISERIICRNLFGFAHAMDNKHWAAFDELATDDLQADFGEGLIKGRTQVVGVMRKYLEHCGVTQHMLGNIIVDVNNDSAVSRAYVADMHLGKGEKNQLTFRTLGVYHDEWVQIGDNWLLSRRVKDNRETIGTLDVFSG